MHSTAHVCETHTAVPPESQKSHSCKLFPALRRKKATRIVADTLSPTSFTISFAQRVQLARAPEWWRPMGATLALSGHEDARGYSSKCSSRFQEDTPAIARRRRYAKRRARVMRGLTGCVGDGRGTNHGHAHRFSRTTSSQVRAGAETVKPPSERRGTNQALPSLSRSRSQRPRWVSCAVLIVTAFVIDLQTPDTSLVAQSSICDMTSEL